MKAAKRPETQPEVEDLIRRAMNIGRLAPSLSERDIHSLAETFAEDLEELLLDLKARNRPLAKVVRMEGWRARRG